LTNASLHALTADRSADENNQKVLKFLIFGRILHLRLKGTPFFSGKKYF
jgi:hypothetical protein